jgi:hypothetical protein
VVSELETEGVTVFSFLEPSSFGLSTAAFGVGSGGISSAGSGVASGTGSSPVATGFASAVFALDLVGCLVATSRTPAVGWL